MLILVCLLFLKKMICDSVNHREQLLVQIHDFIKLNVTNDMHARN